MVRDTAEGKINFLNVRFGPMLRRWAMHLTKGRVKYPDVEPGVPNWTLARGVDEFLRAKESAERHFDAWVRGERDEDHASGVYFNINLAEYVLEQDPSIDPALGARVVKAELEPASSPTTAQFETAINVLAEAWESGLEIAELIEAHRLKQYQEREHKKHVAADRYAANCEACQRERSLDGDACDLP